MGQNCYPQEDVQILENAFYPSFEYYPVAELCMFAYEGQFFKFNYKETALYSPECLQNFAGQQRKLVQKKDPL